MIIHRLIGPLVAEVRLRSLVEDVDLVVVREQGQLSHAAMMHARFCGSRTAHGPLLLRTQRRFAALLVDLAAVAGTFTTDDTLTDGDPVVRSKVQAERRRQYGRMQRPVAELFDDLARSVRCRVPASDVAP